MQQPAYVRMFLGSKVEFLWDSVLHRGEVVWVCDGQPYGLIRTGYGERLQHLDKVTVIERSENELPLTRVSLRPSSWGGELEGWSLAQHMSEAA